MPSIHSTISHIQCVLSSLCLVVFSAFNILYGQAPATQEQAEAVIAANRKGAKPRPVAPGVPLSKEERQREAVFQGAKKSVVFISALPPSSVSFPNPETGQLVAPFPGTGSGFVWDDLGHVVTNYHVVTVEDQAGVPRAEAAKLSVTLHNGKRYQAKVIGRSLAFDIAVLHVFAPLSDMKPLPIGNSRSLRVGQSVLALGNPFGFNHTLTSGIISSLDRKLVTTYGTPIKNVIQTDAAINPGNSGGPLMDLAGHLLGMNTAIASTSGLGSGVGFAIPADTLNRVVPELIEKGSQGRPDLGFVILPPDLTLKIGVKQGLVIWEVDTGSYAYHAGLKPWNIEIGPEGPKGEPKVIETGDLIVGFEGNSLENDLHLFVQMEMHPKGKPFVFDVLRDGKLIKVSIDPWKDYKKSSSTGVSGQAGTLRHSNLLNLLSAFHPAIEGIYSLREACGQLLYPNFELLW